MIEKVLSAKKDCEEAGEIDEGPSSQHKNLQEIEYPWSSGNSEGETSSESDFQHNRKMTLKKARKVMTKLLET